ncbi:molybdopterin oxidoreductase [Lichenibacterium minor]|uniref:Molybdopterin oxidoreductase n=1 Tax=Lichenibacterium minor TaxID=2316528 RepID=A0A4Q2U8J3_9HYPH|nr:molybdopterin oxidoreductase [Lichenibacterium minor]RYC31461.1 molybdopterin oxidoreductase [Lichenibacterium minor]
MLSRPKNLTGVFPFVGTGFERPVPLDASLSYRVPPDRRAQAIYLRAGNSADALACLTITRDGAVMRLFPVGAKAAIHVPLAVLEDLEPDATLGVLVSAPAGAEGHIVLDLGLMEI